MSEEMAGDGGGAQEFWAEEGRDVSGWAMSSSAIGLLGDGDEEGEQGVEGVAVCGGVAIWEGSCDVAVQARRQVGEGYGGCCEGSWSHWGEAADKGGDAEVVEGSWGVTIFLLNILTLSVGCAYMWAEKEMEGDDGDRKSKGDDMSVKVLVALAVTGFVLANALRTVKVSSDLDERIYWDAVGKAGWTAEEAAGVSAARVNESGETICAWTFGVEFLVAMAIAGLLGWVSMLWVAVGGLVVSSWMPLLYLAGLPVMLVLFAAFAVTTVFRVFGEVGNRIMRGG